MLYRRDEESERERVREREFEGELKNRNGRKIEGNQEGEKGTEKERKCV